MCVSAGPVLSLTRVARKITSLPLAKVSDKQASLNLRSPRDWIKPVTRCLPAGAGKASLRDKVRLMWYTFTIPEQHFRCTNPEHIHCHFQFMQPLHNAQLQSIGRSACPSPRWSPSERLRKLEDRIGVSGRVLPWRTPVVDSTVLPPSFPAYYYAID